MGILPHMEVHCTPLTPVCQWIFSFIPANFSHISPFSAQCIILSFPALARRGFFVQLAGAAEQKSQAAECRLAFYRCSRYTENAVQNMRLPFRFLGVIALTAALFRRHSSLRFPKTDTYGIGKAPLHCFPW